MKDKSFKLRKGMIVIMLSKIIMPPGGQTTNESLITLWHKKVGDSVERGDVLFEIETDKATLEVESYAKGILKAVYFNEGEKASTGQTVAYIGNADDVLPEEESTASDGEEDDYVPIMADNKNEKPEYKAEVTQKPENLLSASPKARKTAKDNNINIIDLYESIGKTVKNADVLPLINNIKDINVKEEYYYIKTSSMRRAIASKMDESLKNTAQYTVSMDMCMTKAVSFRKSINEHLGEDEVKVSLNDILIKSVARAVKKFPLINSVYSEENIKVFNSVNCGLAVSIEGGLVVPVIRNTEEKSLSQIANESSNAVKSVKSGKADKKLMSKGTITVSNLGMLGAKHFTAILNYPESCILAVGMIEDKLVIENGEVKAVPNMNITATFDHRVIDGAYGAEFLKELKFVLENPELLAYS